jgi:hypothetical protein
MSGTSPIATDEALMDELEDMRIDAIAAARATTFDPAMAIPLDVMLKKFGVDEA